MATLIQTLQHTLDSKDPLLPAVDLLPMFESRAFIESWLENFHANIERFITGYIDQSSSSL